MAAKKQASTASTKKSTRIVKPNAKKLDAKTAKTAKTIKKVDDQAAVPAPAEQQAPKPATVIELPPLDMSVEAIVSATATATIKPPTEKSVEAPKSVRVSDRKDKPTSGIAALKHEALAAKDAFLALRACDCRFDEQESSGMRKLVRFTLKHAEKIAAGQKVDEVDMRRTIGLARRVAESLEIRFEEIMMDSFKVFDKAMEHVRKNSPDLVIKHGDEIVKLQDALRAVLANSKSTYNQTVDAYKALMGYIPTVSKEAEVALKAERQRRLEERQRTDALQLKSEFEDLNGLDL